MAGSTHACEGCGTPLNYGDSTVLIERHVSMLTQAGEPYSGPSGALTVLQLCLPCATRHIEAIEHAVRETLQRRIGHPLHPQVELVQ